MTPAEARRMIDEAELVCPAATVQAAIDRNQKKLAQVAAADAAKQAREDEKRKKEEQAAQREADRKAKIEAELGLDKPLLQQYLSWIGGLAKGDFGFSYMSERPATAEILARLPVTLKLRLGWDQSKITCIDTAQIAEQSGVSMITSWAPTPFIRS